MNWPGGAAIFWRHHWIMLWAIGQEILYSEAQQVMDC